MTLSYGFYNSVASDRVYDAQQMGMIFDGIIEDGVYATIGESLMVDVDSGMDIVVQTGRAWFNHTWTYNDANVGLSVPTADALLPRIDVVYLEINENTGVRANEVDILEGTPASTPVAPTLTNTSTIHQYPLAHIYVDDGVTSILADDITNKVGLTETPFVTGPLEFITTNELLAQWEAQWETWFQAIQDQLSTEAETNLQAQIWDIVGNLDPPEIDLVTLETHDHATDTPQVPTAGIENDAVTPAKIPNRTRRVMTHTENYDASVGAWGYTLGPSSTNRLAFQYKVPADFVSGLKIILIVSAQDTGPIRIEMDSYFGSLGQIFTTHSENEENTTSSLAVGILTEVANFDIVGIAIGDTIYGHIGRYPAHAGDTNSGAVLAHAVYAEYTADS